MKTYIAYIDNNLATSNNVRNYVQNYGYEILNYNQSNNNEQLFTDIKKKKIALILMNIDQRTNEKYRLTAEINYISNVPIIYISSNFNLDERVRWLTFGATDYIFSPFNPEELALKANLLIKRSNLGKIVDSGIIINLYNRKLTYNGDELKLTPKAFEILINLMQNKGKVVTREKLMESVFDTKHYLSDRKIDAHIKELRKKLNPNYIVTIRNVGYSYTGEVAH